MAIFSLLIKYLVGKNFLCDVIVPEKQDTAKVVKNFEVKKIINFLFFLVIRITL